MILAKHRKNSINCMDAIAIKKGICLKRATKDPQVPGKLAAIRNLAKAPRTAVGGSPSVYCRRP